MIKNLVFDIGGVVTENVLVKSLKVNKEKERELNKIIYKNEKFNKLFLGELTHKEYIKQEYPQYKEEVLKLLSEEYQNM